MQNTITVTVRVCEAERPRKVAGDRTVTTQKVVYDAGNESAPLVFERKYWHPQEPLATGLYTANVTLYAQTQPNKTGFPEQVIKASFGGLVKVS